MIGIEAELDASAEQVRFALLAGRFDDFTPVLTGSVLTTLRSMAQEQFDSKGALGTPVWPLTLSPRTIREKHRLGFGHKPMMRRTDRLYFSLTKRHPDAVVEATEDTLTFGTRVPYAAPHQSGSSRYQGDTLVVLPQRQVIPDPIPTRFVDQIRAHLTAWLLEGRIR